MKYYRMSQDKRIQNKIIFKEFPTDATEEFGTEHISKMKRSVVLHVKDDTHTVYGEVIEAPCYMVSKKIYDVIHMYEPDIAFSNAVYYFQEKQPEDYKVLLVDRMDVLHGSTEFNKDHSLKHLVLDREKIGDMNLFRVQGITPNYIVVSMRIAESILRRNCVGVVLEEIEIR